MNRNCRRTSVVGLVVATLVLLCASGASAQLTSTLNVSPADYRGNCPGLITFNGTITSDKAQTVTYVFTRSDGATDTQPKTVVFTAAGSKPVSDTWTLGGEELPYYAGWEAVKITAPSVVVSNQASFKIRCNPPLNSVLAAHGNTDWHIDTANEFLYGTNMAGTTTASHHAPDSWTKAHIHVGQTNASKYYYDKEVVKTGEDTNRPNGIDRAMLFFYAGHGNPVIWNTLGDSATQASVRLANVAGGGTLRYYWQCSCDVFAHGPRTCNPATTFEYGCPDQFTGAADSDSMRNVFERWGPALTSDLRMACGGSTAMYCHTQQVDRAWSDYGSGTIANMFLDGFGEDGAYGVVPVCITRGGNDITKTPLYDTEFTNEPNRSGFTRYYLMYPAGSQSAPAIHLVIPKVPKQFVKYRVRPLPPPPPILVQMKKPGVPISIASRLVAGGKAQVRRVEQSGALYLDSGQVAAPGAKVLAEREYIRRAANFLAEQSWREEEAAQPVVTRYMTASMPIEGRPSEMRRAQAGATVQYKRVVRADGIPIEVLGAAGTMRVHMNNAGVVLKATKQWHALERSGSPAPAKGFEEARAEATRTLGAAEGYRLQQCKLGYKLQADELVPIYQFAFVPAKAGDMEHPPQLVEVSAITQ